MNRLLPPLVAMALAAGCGKSVPGLGEQIAAQYASEAPVIDLGAVGPADWDRVCIFAPYSTAQLHGRPALGFDWDMDSLSSIGSNEGISLLVFVQGQQVQAFVDHARGKGDFAYAARDGQCFSRDAAKFRRKPMGEWVALEPVENALARPELRQDPS
jgi:hypothetical protein